MAAHFEEHVISTVHSRLPSRWAIWPEPVLYFTSDNSAERRSDYTSWSSAFLPYLNVLMGVGVSVAGKMAGFGPVNHINSRVLSKNA
jgi:hypothetical protein